MHNVDDSVIINFNLREDLMESHAEVITHIGSLRTVVNTFKGQDAVTLYTGLMGKNAVTFDEEVKRLLGIVSPSEHYQNMFNRPVEYAPLKPTFDISTDELKPLTWEHSGELAPDILVRHNFHLESTAKCVLDDIKMMLEKYGSYTMSDWKDAIDGIQEMSDFGYILDDSEEMIVLQSEEGFYIYPLIFKPINTHVSSASQSAMEL